MNKVILLLDDSEAVNAPIYLSQLVSMGIYNFTKIFKSRQRSRNFLHFIKNQLHICCRNLLAEQSEGIVKINIRKSIHQQLHIGATPFVDILIRVAYDHQILVFFRKPVHQLHLRVGAVLKLVHLDIVQPILP